jgi:hypothetical protein
MLVCLAWNDLVERVEQQIFENSDDKAARRFDQTTAAC